MKPEQGGLLRKAGDSLNAAKLMQQNGYYDFAASRAYYAMFYLAEAFLLEYSLAFSKHSAVIAAFGERFTKTGLVPAELHRYLRDGQDSRNVGDYGRPSRLANRPRREISGGGSRASGSGSASPERTLTPLNDIVDNRGENHQGDTRCPSVLELNASTCWRRSASYSEVPGRAGLQPRHGKRLIVGGFSP
jgi:uncharacterized protein (UPF0332 family)